MTEGLIDYESMMKDALRQVVARALTDAGLRGLPGEHHFYIAFRTDVPGVQIPPYLKAVYPEEMTIVLQHQFWGLKVHDDWFEVGLSFNKKPERLVIPFAALVGFYDPSVQFGLQFQAETEAQDQNRAPTASVAGATTALMASAPEQQAGDVAPKVVTLDAFRKK